MMDDISLVPPGPLADRLEAARVEAQALREQVRREPPTEADLAQSLASMRLLDLFLDDLGEALRQIFVAGLSFPDPELPEALGELRARARALRLATAHERLDRLQAWLQATLASPDIEARLALTAGAWGETQRLLAWSRLYRAEHDLQAVQARLAAEAQGVKIASEPTFATASLSVWPVGVELAPSGKFVVHGQSDVGGKPVVLTDHLAEVTVADPFHHGAISRLFQEKIELPRLLRSLIRFDEHPFTEKDGVINLRPAFRSIPKMLPVVDGFKPPKLPKVDVSLGAEIPAGPFLIDAVVTWSSGRLHVGSLQGELPIKVTPLVRFNLAKMLVREGLRRDEVVVCLQATSEDFELLHVVTGLDGRSFPGVDPTAYRVAREVLQHRADRVKIAGEPVAGLFLRTAAYVLGRGPLDGIARLRSDVLEAKPKGIEEHYRVALARGLLGIGLDPHDVVPLLTEALALLTRAPSAPVDTGRLARVLGRPAARVSASDVRDLDGAVAYRVVWLAMQAGVVDQLRGPLRLLFDGVYRGELTDPTVGDVCARALLLVLLSGEPVGDTRIVGAEPGDEATAPAAAVAAAAAEDDDEDDEDDDEDDEDGGTVVVQAVSGVVDREAAVWVTAREFLQAHLEDLAPRKATTKTHPLPEPIELLQLGDTRAFLQGSDRLGATLADVKLPVDRLRHACAEALLAWCTALDGQPTGQVAVGAADALLAAVAAGQDRFFLS